jgi:Cu/Ag efflux pump CusA
LQNSAMYSPLAWVIIGGLLSSTLVARIVTPAIYKLIPPAIETDTPQSAATAAVAAPAHG